MTTSQNIQTLIARVKEIECIRSKEMILVSFKKFFMANNLQYWIDDLVLGDRKLYVRNVRVTSVRSIRTPDPKPLVIFLSPPGPQKEV